MKRWLRYALTAALVAVPSLVLAQAPISLCTPLFNATTGALSCVPVGQTSPNITAPNPLPVGGIANAAAPTFTEGRAGYLSFDLSGNVRVVGSFTPSGTSPEFTPVAPATATATVGVLMGGQYDSTQKTLTNGQQAAASFSARGALFVAAGADGFAVTNAGTFATQSAITAAIGSISSGAVASGAVASGAYASGALASGSIASGAMVDLVASQTPVAAATATATKGLLLGGQYDSTQKTLTTGQQAAFSASPRGAMFVAVGADGFAVTNAGTFAVQAAVTAASGAFASGSIASGAMVDLGAIADAAATPGSTGSVSAKLRLATASKAPVAPATATATQSDLIGCQATTAAVNPTTGQQGACSSDTNNNILTSSGGSPNLTTGQVTVTTASTATCAARALRRSCTVTNITGTQQVYCSGTTATTGNGQLIPAVVGANWTVSTAAAVNCIAVSSSQTVSVAEIY